MTEKEAESILNAVYPKPAVRSRSARRQYESQMDVSVIIPAYNVQPYIRECLDSVVNQDLRTSWEVIVVDDGSDDGTEAILEEYKAYPQIRVIRQENGGLSSARNTGLINAQGKHLLFLDGDDALADGCLSVLMEAAGRQEADIIQMGYQYLEGGRLLPPKKAGPTGRIREYGTMCRLPGFAWMKLYKSSLFSGVFFPEGYWFEDSIVHLILFDRCRELLMLEKTGYLYRVNPEGICSTSRSHPKCLDALWVIEPILKMRNELGMEMTKDVYVQILAHLSTTLYRRIKWMDEKVIQAAFIKACALTDGLMSQKERESLLAERPDNDPLLQLEEAFRKRDYGIWRLYCRCL